MGHVYKFCFLFALFAGLGYHYWTVKTPDQGRGIASYVQQGKYFYDASYKL